MSVGVACGVWCLIVAAFMAGCWWANRLRVVVVVGSAEEESLVESFMADLAVEQEEHTEALRDANEMAEHVRRLLYGYYRDDPVPAAVEALRAFDGERAHRG